MKNKKTIKIIDIKNHGRHHDQFCNDVLMLRTARNIGDVETVNHYVISILNRFSSDITYKIIN